MWPLLCPHPCRASAWGYGLHPSSLVCTRNIRNQKKKMREDLVAWKTKWIGMDIVLQRSSHECIILPFDPILNQDFSVSWDYLSLLASECIHPKPLLDTSAEIKPALGLIAVCVEALSLHRGHRSRVVLLISSRSSHWCFKLGPLSPWISFPKHPYSLEATLNMDLASESLLFTVWHHVGVFKTWASFWIRVLNPFNQCLHFGEIWKVQYTLQVREHR